MMQIEVERSNRVHILEHYYTKVLYSKLQLSAYLLCYDTVYFYQLLNERGALEGASKRFIQYLIVLPSQSSFQS